MVKLFSANIGFRIFLFTIFCGMYFNPPVARSEIYVDSIYGFDSNSGKDILDPKKSLQAAVDQASTSETIIISGGYYHENIVVSKPGVSIIADPHLEQPKVEAVSGQSSLIDILTTEVKVSGLHLNTGELPQAVGVRLRNPSGCVVTNCHFTCIDNAGGIGIEIYPFSDVTDSVLPKIGDISQENDFDGQLQMAISFANRPWSSSSKHFDISNNKFNGIAASTATSTQSLIIESLIHHGVDYDAAANTPICTWIDQNVFITSQEHGTEELNKALISSEPGMAINLGPAIYVDKFHILTPDMRLKGMDIAGESAVIQGAIEIRHPE